MTKLIVAVCNLANAPTKLTYTQHGKHDTGCHGGVCRDCRTLGFDAVWIHIWLLAFRGCWLPPASWCICEQNRCQRDETSTAKICHLSDNEDGGGKTFRSLGNYIQIETMSYSKHLSRLTNTTAAG
jgi:hypothetical protein